jgi:hypothetical protein
MLAVFLLQVAWTLGQNAFAAIFAAESIIALLAAISLSS